MLCSGPRGEFLRFLGRFSHSVGGLCDSRSPFQSLLFRGFSLKGSLWPVHTTWPALETLSPQGLQNDTPKTPVLFFHQGIQISFKLSGLFVRMRETVLELWIACHMPRGQYIVIYERKGPRAQRAKRALRREARLAARLAARLGSCDAPCGAVISGLK